jgi:hypothetical protein
MYNVTVNVSDGYNYVEQFFLLNISNEAPKEYGTFMPINLGIGEFLDMSIPPNTFTDNETLKF